MQKVCLTRLFILFTFFPFVHTFAGERTPFSSQSLQGTWVITKLESKIVLDGEESTQEYFKNGNNHSKLTFMPNGQFEAIEMRAPQQNGKLETSSFSGVYSLEEKTGKISLQFKDPSDNQVIHLFFKVQATAEGIALQVDKEELFQSMDYISARDSFMQTFNELFKQSVQSYSTHYILRKSYQ